MSSNCRSDGEGVLPRIFRVSISVFLLFLDSLNTTFSYIYICLSVSLSLCLCKLCVSTAHSGVYISLPAFSSAISVHFPASKE